MSAPLFSAAAWPFGSLRPMAYRAILADPAWSFRTYSEKGLGKSPQRHYECQGLDWIKALPVADLAHPEGCALIVWATAPMLPQAIETVAAWGFTKDGHPRHPLYLRTASPLLPYPRRFDA